MKVARREPPVTKTRPTSTSDVDSDLPVARKMLLRVARMHSGPQLSARNRPNPLPRKALRRRRLTCRLVVT
jgi:hypothetical protein